MNRAEIETLIPLVFPDDAWDVPTSKFQKFKKKYFPKWALKRWPVKTYNLIKEINQIFDEVASVGQIQRGRMPYER